jgi:TolB-like protein/class 3 adenylate cyclase/Tfp pilus assembly protein PilF
MTSEKVERRLAAILSADAVGYSRLMAEDEGGTIRTITAHRRAMESCIERERGRVVDSPGDNVLAEFPTALEALRSALEIQGVLAQRNAELPAERRMQFRIGVHLGDVAAEGERLYGDGVNIAARMEAMAQPGGILISDLVLRQVRGKLDASFEDLGEKDLKNIPDPLRVYGVTVGSEPSAEPRPGRFGARRLFAVAVAVIALAGLFLWASWPRVTGLALDAAGLSLPENPPLPDKPSIVVLPFENMSGDPDQEYFSDGLSEDLTTQLSLNPQLFVIARNSAFTYKGQAVNVEQVGRELGVRYVLEGSVRKSAGRVRVTAQLIDATSGFHLWSQRYDREMAEIFALQDEISERIFQAVGVEIRAAELQRVRRKPTKDLNAYEAWQRGYYHFVRFRIEDMAKAEQWFERAIELDPDFAQAICQLASIQTASVAMGWPVEPDALDRALELADRAYALDPFLANVYLVRAGVHLNRNESRKAEAAARRVIEMTPSESIAHVFLGIALLQQQRVAEALASFRTAVRNNPRASEVAPMRAVIALAQYRLGQTEEAVELWESARAANPDLVTYRIPLIEHYESIGEHVEASEIVGEVLAVNPDMTARVAASSGFAARVPDEIPALIAVLRRAGLP